MEGNSWVGKMDSVRRFVMVKGGDRWKTEKSPRKERLAAEGLWNNEMPGSGDEVRFGGKKTQTRAKDRRRRKWGRFLGFFRIY